MSRKGDGDGVLGELRMSGDVEMEGLRRAWQLLGVGLARHAEKRKEGLRDWVISVAQAVRETGCRAMSAGLWVWHGGVRHGCIWCWCMAIRKWTAAGYPRCSRRWWHGRVCERAGATSIRGTADSANSVEGGRGTGAGRSRWTAC